MRVLVVTAMYPTKDQPAYGTFVKEQVESLRSAGIEVDVLVKKGNAWIKGYWTVGQAMRRLVKAKPYDIIHAHYGLSGATAKMQTGLPVVVTFHGSDLLGGVGSKYQYTLRGALEVLISRLAGLVATKCIVVADLLKPKLWPRSSITIPMGVDLSRFKPIHPWDAREKLGLSHDKKRVLFVASPTNPTKRFDIAQAAVDVLQESNPDVELLPIYNQPHATVPLHMNGCDVLVLTSMHEASPCVIKEAMACNLPIVSVDVGDVAERINGVTGSYLCERTPEDVAKKLRWALEGGRSTNGREKIQHLSLQNVAKELIALYKGLIDQNSHIAL